MAFTFPCTRKPVDGVEHFAEEGLYYYTHQRGPIVGILHEIATQALENALEKKAAAADISLKRNLEDSNSLTLRNQKKPRLCASQVNSKTKEVRQKRVTPLLDLSDYKSLPTNLQNKQYHIDMCKEFLINRNYGKLECVWRLFPALHAYKDGEIVSKCILKYSKNQNIV